ncbi:hypothetical protein FLTE109939_09730 [Flavobacterium terrigena]|uniref:Uncharacterized protein n=1 Tax=Flavobacterium terrigena TaxID=402734 RepID=A0A1H6U633_9FLAO|nr:hypothetical protein SAMN05660918_1788 [Flavobacterium terrigena]
MCSFGASRFEIGQAEQSLYRPDRFQKPVRSNHKKTPNVNWEFFYLQRNTFNFVCAFHILL